jgi:SAM-dependent methyltransferase
MCASLSCYTLEDQERMTRATNYFAWQHRLVLAQLGQRVIEIGCGIGNFTRLLLDREAVLAIDVEPGCTARLVERFPNRPNLRAITADFGSSDADMLRSFRADTSVCLNVLEHIGDDREALRLMADALVPGGVAILLVPAFPSLYGPIDHLLGHYRRYTRASIAELGESVGFSVRTAHYLNAIGFFGWWVNAHILKRRAQSAAQIEFFDRYIVPFSSRVEGWIHPPLGQSLFVVFEKSL